MIGRAELLAAPRPCRPYRDDGVASLLERADRDADGSLSAEEWDRLQR